MLFSEIHSLWWKPFLIVEAWNYSTNRNVEESYSFIKVLSIWHVFEGECNSLKTKKNITRDHTTKLIKNWFSFLVSEKGQKKKDKREFVTKNPGIKVNLFSRKNIFQIVTKIFAATSFSEQLNRKTTIVVLSWSRNMIGRFMKTYLRRPIKILQLLTPGRIQKCLK